MGQHFHGNSLDVCYVKAKIRTGKCEKVVIGAYIEESISFVLYIPVTSTKTFIVQAYS